MQANIRQLYIMRLRLLATRLGIGLGLGIAVGLIIAAVIIVLLVIRKQGCPRCVMHILKYYHVYEKFRRVFDYVYHE